MLLAGFILLFASSLVNVYFSIQILRKVSSAKVKISFFELRYQVHKHLPKYKQLCYEQRGRLGNEYYGYWLSLAVMILSALIMFYQLPWDSLNYKG